MNKPRREPHVCRSALVFALLLLAALALPAAEPFLQKIHLFTEETDGFRLYRIPGIVVTARGSVLAYCEARKFAVADRGEIEIHLRRSTDGGRAWSPAKQVAHLGPRLPRNPHMPEGNQDMGGPNEQTVNNPVAIAARDGTVLCFYESGDPDSPRKHGRPWAYSFLTVARFNLAWLAGTNQTPNPTHDGPKAGEKQ